jgi:hypothetical protein
VNNAESEESDVNSNSESSDDDSIDGHQGVKNADSEESDDNSEESDDDSDEVPVAVEENSVDNTVVVKIVNDEEEDDAEDDIDTEMDVAYGERRSDHKLRPRRKVSYSHLHVNFEELNLGHLEELNQGVECNEEQIKGVNERT